MLTDTQTIHRFAFDHIHNNPFQTRGALDPATVQARAADIRQRGLLQVPLARPKPGAPLIDGVPQDIELAFGHTRSAAWHVAYPEQAFPVILRDLTDREMSEHAIAENGHRSDLTAIEKARALKHHIEAFKVTQKDAAKLMGLDDPSSVSNLISLLELPVEIQDRVNAGQLPEALARSLRTVARYFPVQAAAAANAIAKANEADRQEVARSAISQIWNKHAQDLNALPWDKKWSPDAKLSVDMHRADKGEPALPPPCEGCKHLHKFGDREYCATPACYNLKFRIHAVQEAVRRSKVLGIAVAQPEENITILMGHETAHGYNTRDKMIKVVRKASRLPSLRLVPLREIEEHPSWYLSDVTGSRVVLLGTINKAEVDRFLSNGDAKPEKPKQETAAQKTSRIAQEEKEAAGRYRERCEFLKGKHDVLWLLEHTAAECAKQMQIAGGVLIKSETLVHVDATFNTQIEEIAELHNRLRKGVYPKLWNGYAEERALPKGDSPEIEHLRRTHIIFDLLATEVLGNRTTQETFKWGDAQHKTERIITRGLLLTLPKEWNTPPVHKTAFNCWTCGKFAGNERGLTKAEKSAGWDAVTVNGKIVRVHCPEHKYAVAADHAPASKRKGKGKK